MKRQANFGDIVWLFLAIAAYAVLFSAYVGKVNNKLDAIQRAVSERQPPQEEK